MISFFFFFFNDTATTEIYTLSLHDALPICHGGVTARPSDNLPAFARRKLNIMHDRTHWDIFDNRSKTRFDFHLSLRTDNLVADTNVCRSDNIVLRPISIKQEGNERGAVRIIFDGRNLCRNIKYDPLAVYQADFLPRPAADVPDSDMAVMVPAAAFGLGQKFRSRPLRFFCQIRIDNHGSFPESRCCRFI